MCFQEFLKNEIHRILIAEPDIKLVVPEDKFYLSPGSKFHGTCQI